MESKAKLKNIRMTSVVLRTYKDEKEDMNDIKVQLDISIPPYVDRVYSVGYSWI